MVLRVKLICGDYELEIPANPYPMYPHVERLNNISLESATGDLYVFDDGPTRVNASIVWKAIDYEVAKLFENFILNHIRLGQVPFKIVCPYYIDFGNGKGEDVEAAYYAGPTALKKIISQRGEAGLFYDIELPYMFVREEKEETNI